MLCDSPTVQRHRPQIAIVAEAICPQRVRDGVAPTLPANVKVWRRESGWINHDVLSELIETLAAQVKEVALDSSPILCMDAHTVHFSDKVLRAAQPGGSRIVIIRASCTQRLQMLETDMFARFKVFFRQRLHRRMAAGRNGDLGTDVILEKLVSTIAAVLEGHDWSSVFRNMDLVLSLSQGPRCCERWGGTAILNCLPASLPTMASVRFSRTGP